MINYRHQNKDFSLMLAFPDKVKGMTPQALSHSTSEVYPWERMTVVIVGDKSLVQSLSKVRPVKIIDYKDYL